jgi:hypothetical protein
MSDAGESFTCRNCGRAVAGETPDRNGWCRACRRVVVRRSAALAILPALVVLVLYGWLLAAFGLFGSTFLMVWIALGVGLAYIAFKVARRVFFEIIRARGVKPPVVPS